MKRGKKSSAFTIIEIMITLLVLGVVVGFAVMKYPGVMRRSRDAQRESDLASYRNALELYAMKNNGLYPTSIPAADITLLCTTLGVAPSACKDDPKSGTYYYQTDTSGKEYTLWSSLEDNSNAYIACSTGENGLAYVTPADGLCPDFQAGAPPTPTPDFGGLPTSTPTNTPIPTNTPTPTITPTPTPYIVLNSSSLKSCKQKCESLGKTCISIGTDALGTDGQYYKYIYDASAGTPEAMCHLTTGDRDTIMTKNSPKKCSGINADWTNCRCSN